MITNRKIRSSFYTGILIGAIFIVLLSGCTEHAEDSVFDPVELVNPLMGTDSEFILSNGNTYPAIALPWGMNFWSPQTRKMGDGWGYTYDDYKIMGIKQTHQPIQHMIYLYNYAGQPWKSQFRARQVMDKLYNYTPDGYCGDEDNGQTSAWYVFSALGFYPVTPGTDQYVFGSPLFNKVTLDFGKRKKLVIEAPDNSRENVYIKGIKLNGRKIDKNYITHSDLQSGGKLVYDMSSVPDSIRGTKPEAYPYSMSVK